MAPLVTLTYLVEGYLERVETRVGPGWKFEIGTEGAEVTYLVDHFRVFSTLDTSGEGPPVVKRSLPPLV